MELFLTGYCRALDKSRIVLLEDGEADCAFANCPHAQSCEIARQIRENLEDGT